MLLAVIYALTFGSSTGSVESVSAIAERLRPGLNHGLEVDPRLAQDRVFVSDPSAPSDKLISALAQALHASIVPTKSGLLLKRTEKDEKDLKAAEAAERAGWLRKRIAAIQGFRAAKLAEKPIAEVIAETLNTEQTARAAFFERRGAPPVSFFESQLLPAESLLENLIDRIGLANILSTPEGNRTIFEDFPVDQATELPPHEDLLQAYAKASEPFTLMALNPDAKRQIASMRLAAYFSQIGKQATLPSKLRLHESMRRTSILFNLEGFSESGARVLKADLFTELNSPDLPAVSLANLAKAKVDATWIDLPKSLTAALESVKPGARPSPGTPDWLFHPDLSEPMNLFVAPILRRVADEAPNKLSVFLVDDSFWNFARYTYSNGRFCLSAFKQLLSDVDDYEHVTGGDIEVWRPRIPEGIEHSTADRRALANFVRRVLSDRGDSLRSLAQLFHDSSAETSELVWYWARDMAQRAPIQSDLDLGAEALRFLGSIPDDAWRVLLNGRPKTAADCQVVSDLRRLLLSDQQRTIGPGNPTDLQWHSMELFESTPLDDAQLRFQPKTLVVCRVAREGRQSAQWSTLDSLPGVELVRAVVRPKGFEIVDSQESYEARIPKTLTLTFARESDLVITIALPHSRRIEFTHRGVVSDAGEPMAYADLPADLRSQIWQQAKSNMEQTLTKALADYHSDEPNTIGKPIIKP